MKTKYITITLCVLGGIFVGAVLGFSTAILLYKLSISGAGFSVKTPNSKQGLLIMGYDEGFYGSRRVSICRTDNLPLKLKPVFTYLHSSGAYSLRGQKNKKTEWLDDFRKVKVTYTDKIYDESVLMTFEYDTNSGDWILSKKRAIIDE